MTILLAIINTLKIFLIAGGSYQVCKHLFKIKSKTAIAVIIFTMLVLVNIVSSAEALTLEGGVKKIETAQEAKEYVFKYVPVKLIDPTPYKAYANKAPEGYRTDLSDGRYSIATNHKVLTYTKHDKLEYIAISDKNVLDFPRKLNRYEYPSGKLIEVTYGTSPEDGFIFLPDGSLVGIWENGVYREGDKTLNTAKTTYFD